MFPNVCDFQCVSFTTVLWGETANNDVWEPICLLFVKLSSKQAFVLCMCR